MYGIYVRKSDRMRGNKVLCVWLVCVFFFCILFPLFPFFCGLEKTTIPSQEIREHLIQGFIAIFTRRREKRMC